MNDESYEKLLISIKKNQLKEYLKGKENYRVSSPDEKYFDIMNNYQSIILSLNKYGKNNKEFSQHLQNNVIEILQEKKPLSTYSMYQLIRLQIVLEMKGENSIEFINEKTLLELKNSILENKSFFENFNGYEAFNSKRGMMEIFENWADNIEKTSGKHILWTEEEIKKEE